MAQTNKFSTYCRILGVLVAMTVAFSGVALGAVSLDGDFGGEMVGYGDKANEEAGDSPNEITVEGSFTVEGEPVKNVTIEATSDKYTVLDTSSVELLVPGEGIEFDTFRGADRVTKSTAKLPEGTQVELSFSVYYIGDSDRSIEDDTIDAADIEVEYRTLGDSEGSKKFDAETNVSNRPESVIADKERGETLGTVQKVLSYVGGLALAGVVLYLFAAIIKSFGNGGKKKPN